MAMGVLCHVVVDQDIASSLADGIQSILVLAIMYS